MRVLVGLSMQRADAELGRAWRRCETALPGWEMGSLIQIDPARWKAIAHRWNVVGFLTVDSWDGPEADTPTDALNALAEVLEARDTA